MQANLDLRGARARMHLGAQGQPVDARPMRLDPCREPHLLVHLRRNARAFTIEVAA